MAATLTAWKIYIIEPEAAINLDTNPSAETNVTGDTVVNGAVTQSSEQARYGKYARKIVPTDANETWYYRSLALTAGVTYTFSTSVFGESGKTYGVRFTDGSNNVVATTPLTGNGKWQRKAVSYTAASTATYRYGVVRNGGQATTAAFYVDGHVLKVGSDNLYFDGDTVDPYQATPQFYWTGTPHASTSVRLASTRYGGTLLDISNYATVRAIQGLGLATFETNTSSLALGGEIYQNSHANAREFSLICLASTPLTSPYGTLQRKLARLEKAVNPKRMKVDQPMRLLIYGVDSAGVEASDPVLIDCIYEGGLEGDLSNRAPSFAMRFKMTDPLIKADGYNVTSLSPNTTVDGGTYGSLLLISEDTGSTTAITGFGGHINGLTPDNSGGFYIYGEFSNYGDSNGNGIVYRNAAGTISSMGSGAVAAVKGAILGPDGKLYITGTGANIGGVAAADYIGRWTGSAWEAVGSSGLNAYGYCIASDNFGNIYIGGNNSTAGGVTVNQIAKYTPSTDTWAALGSGTVGTNGNVISVVCLPDGTVVFGGDFTEAGGNSALGYLAYFDGTNYGGLGAAPNGPVYILLYDNRTGNLYAFGGFTEIGGISANNAAYWDGNNWNPMSGADGPLSVSYIFSATIHNNGNVYAHGNFDILGRTYSNTIAYWNGAEWRLPEFENDKTIDSVLYRSLTREFVIPAYASSGSTTYTIPAVSTITNSTEGNIYPSITLDSTGYYVYSLYNRSTGERIFLNGLQVYTGEKIELIFSPTGYTITSNIRGDMRSAVLSGSSPTFHLQPGTNYVSCFVYPSPTASVTIPLKYPAAGYISLNETVYE